MSVLEFIVLFYSINTAWVVFSSDLTMDPLNLYLTALEKTKSEGANEQEQENQTKLNYK